MRLHRAGLGQPHRCVPSWNPQLSPRALRDSIVRHSRPPRPSQLFEGPCLARQPTPPSVLGRPSFPLPKARVPTRRRRSNNPQLTLENTRRSVPAVGAPTDRRSEWSAGVAQTRGRRPAWPSSGGQRSCTGGAARRDRRRSTTTRAEVAQAFYRVLALSSAAIDEEALKLFEARPLPSRSDAAPARTPSSTPTWQPSRPSGRNQLAQSREQLLEAQAELATKLQLDLRDAEVGQWRPAAGRPTVHAGGVAVRSRPSPAPGAGCAAGQRHLAASARRVQPLPRRDRRPQRRPRGPRRCRERLTTLSVSVPLPLFKRNAAGIGRPAASWSQCASSARPRRATPAPRSTRCGCCRACGRVRRLQESVLPALADNQQLSIKSQRAGQIGLLELIVVNRQALDARRDLVEALADFRPCGFALEAAAGWNPEEPTHEQQPTMPAALADDPRRSPHAECMRRRQTRSRSQGGPEKAAAKGDEHGDKDGIKLSEEEARRAGIARDTGRPGGGRQRHRHGNDPGQPGPRRTRRPACRRPHHRRHGQPGRPGPPRVRHSRRSTAWSSARRLRPGSRPRSSYRVAEADFQTIRIAQRRRDHPEEGVPARVRVREGRSPLRAAEDKHACSASRLGGDAHGQRAHIESVFAVTAPFAGTSSRGRPRSGSSPPQRAALRGRRPVQGLDRGRPDRSAAVACAWGCRRDGDDRRLSGERFSGRVTYVASMLDKEKRTIPARIEVENKDGRLKPRCSPQRPSPPAVLPPAGGQRADRARRGDRADAGRALRVRVRGTAATSSARSSPATNSAAAPS